MQKMNEINGQKQIVGIYCRISKEDNIGMESQSIKSQKDCLYDYVKIRGWSIYNMYIDDGFSGVSFDRPAFKRMINDIEQKKINCVIVKDLSRLGRNYLECGYFIEKYFPEHNVRFIAVNDFYDALEGEDDFNPFKNIINEWYAKDISKKIKFSFKIKAQQGELVQGIVPYGYVCFEHSKNYIIDEEAANVIRYIFQKTYEMVPACEIIEFLKSSKVYVPGYYNYLKKGIHIEKYKGFTEEKKYDWNYWKLDHLLKNEIYKGTLVNFKRKKVSFRSNKLVANDLNNIIKFENRFPAIVSKDIFYAVQEIRNNKFRAPRTEHKEFCHLVYCGDCGKNLILRKQGNEKYPYYYFFCAKEDKGCGKHYLRLDVLKNLIIKDFEKIKEVINFYSEEQILKIILKVKEKNQFYISKIEKNDINKLKNKVLELENLMEKTFESFAKGILPNTVYLNLMSKYKTEFEKSSSLLQSFNDDLIKENNKKEFIKIIEYLKNMSTEELFSRRLLNKLIKKIEIFDAKNEGKIIRTIKISYV